MEKIVDVAESARGDDNPFDLSPIIEYMPDGLRRHNDDKKQRHLIGTSTPKLSEFVTNIASACEHIDRKLLSADKFEQLANWLIASPCRVVQPAEAASRVLVKSTESNQKTHKVNKQHDERQNNEAAKKSIMILKLKHTEKGSTIASQVHAKSPAKSDQKKKRTKSAATIKRRDLFREILSCYEPPRVILK